MKVLLVVSSLLLVASASRAMSPQERLYFSIPLPSAGGSSGGGLANWFNNVFNPGRNPPSTGTGPTNPGTGNSNGPLCLHEHNQQRAQNGLPALGSDPRLEQASQFHNNWMTTHNCGISHQCPGEPDAAQRVAQTGYPLMLVGENVAGRFPNCQAAVTGWMGSAGHRANILGTHFTEMGCHYDGNWYTCVFSRKAA